MASIILVTILSILSIFAVERITGQYNERPCSTEGGKCQKTSSSCSGQYKSGLCPTQAANIKCCLASGVYNEAACSAKSGKCQLTSRNCAGTYQSGLCPTQASNVKCCIGSSAVYNEAACSGQSGKCQLTTQSCNGQYLSGFCPTQPSNVKCCTANTPAPPASGSTTPKRIAALASRHIGSTAWSYYKPKGSGPGAFGPNTYKCNLFVHDVLIEAGLTPPTYGPPAHYPIVAADWDNSKYTIKNWKHLGRSAVWRAGDVVSIRRITTSATGHTGIAVSSTSFVSAGKTVVYKTASHSSVRPGVASVRRYVGP